jgi:hypothetical protein
LPGDATQKRLLQVPAQPTDQISSTGFRAFGTEAVQLVFQATTLGSNGEIYMLEWGIQSR